MAEFWETSFREKQAMWGFEPSRSAVLAKDLFLERKVEDVLIPGVGYGRNAQIFVDNGFKVTGIEISKTAIDLSRQNDLDITIYHGSVADMPFDDTLFGGIFCHGLIHLLNKRERKVFIGNCYRQLKPNGYMVFTAVSKKAPMFGQGKQLSKDRFAARKGLSLFFYNSDSVKKEFGKYGLVDFFEIDEFDKGKEGKRAVNFILIQCKKC